MAVLKPQEELENGASLEVKYLSTNAVEIHGMDEDGNDLGSLGTFVLGEGFHPGAVSGALQEIGFPVDGNGKIIIVS